MVQFSRNLPPAPTVRPADAPALRFSQTPQAVDQAASPQAEELLAEDMTTLNYGNVARAAGEPSQLRFP